MDVFFVFLLLFTEIVLFIVAWVIFKGDFISPSVVTLALFILSTACFAYNTNQWIVGCSFKAYALFTLSFILMIMTERFIARHKFVFGKKKIVTNKISVVSENQILYIPQPFDWLLFIFFGFCAIYYIFRVYQAGMSYGATGLLSAIGYNKEEGDYDALSRLLYNLIRMASYVYIVIFCNNVLKCRESIKNNWQSFAIVLLTTIITFFSGQRSATIAYIVGFVVAASIFLYDAKKRGARVDLGKFFRKIVLAAIVVIAIFFASANLVKATSIQREFIDYMTYYFGSTTALMTRIVDEPELCHTAFMGYFGEKTFNGFWKDMYSWGIVDSAPCDRKWIKMGGPIITRAGNEYTFLCGPYIDFGFVGTLIFIIAFFAVFSYIYYWKIRKYQNIMKKCTYISIYIFLYAMIALAFYQDTIRSYARTINILYIIYIVMFIKVFLRYKLQNTNDNRINL